MAISYSTLRAAASNPTGRVARSIQEAARRSLKTAFLCHSHADKELVRGFVEYVSKKGWDVYIDWMDEQLPSAPSRVTAEKIRLKIRSSDIFIFLATHNYVSSRWCPWEIGYGDAVKFGNDILVVQTIDDRGNFHGNEYLQLYRKLDTSSQGPLAVFEPGATLGKFATSL